MAPWGATVYTDDGADNIWFTLDDTTANTSAQNNPYTFTGQRLDNLDSDALQIMYYKNRYYDTETGRFIHRDRNGVQDGLGLFIFDRSGNPMSSYAYNLRKQYQDSLNLFLYAAGNPTVNLDPYGNAILTVVISAYALGNAASNFTQSFYWCYLFNDCIDR
ncbi:MAG: hypothetical protein IIB19_05635, partial [Chloroflexi bacterium]|nr:hypothetical protein [Chloroflexota bacterium]